MSYLYGVRYTMEENDLILSLRQVRPRLLQKVKADISIRNYTQKTTIPSTGQPSETTSQKPTYMHPTAGSSTLSTLFYLATNTVPSLPSDAPVSPKLMSSSCVRTRTRNTRLLALCRRCSTSSLEHTLKAPRVSHTNSTLSSGRTLCG